METVKILKEHGADINVQSSTIKMTPLHWAAYNDDHALVSYLLGEGAQMKFSRAQRGEGTDATAVDIAGTCDNETIVYIFAKWNEERLARRAQAMIDANGPLADEENGGNNNRVAPTPNLEDSIVGGIRAGYDKFIS